MIELLAAVLFGAYFNAVLHEVSEICESEKEIKIEVSCEVGRTEHNFMEGSFE